MKSLVSLAIAIILFFATACKKNNTVVQSPVVTDTVVNNLEDPTYDSLRKVGTSLPAFPGATGSGTYTIGGRGGQIVEVTNLNDAGVGSLRDALNKNFPRIVIFKIAGTIKILSQLRIDNPFVTIAGQTAPGGGILISAELINDDAFYIYTHDVVMRYIKIRAGKGASFTDQLGDCIGIGDVGKQTFNIVIDHCSFSWGNDEIGQIWVNNGSGGTICRDITFSNNIFAEPLNYNDHAYGFIAGSNGFCDSLINLDFHHNLFIHSKARNVQMRIASFRFINNLIYNGGWYTQIEGGVYADIVGNKYIRGINHAGRAELMLNVDNQNPTDCYLHGVNRDPSVFFKGNVGPNNANSTTDNWGLMDELTHDVFRSTGKKIPALYRRNTLLAQVKGKPIVPENILLFETVLLNTVGAFQRLEGNGTWSGNRDGVDQRLIQEYNSRTGFTPTDENSVGGFPVIESGIAYVDSDKDGMADSWELIHGLNPNNIADGNLDSDNDGYTNIEEFLNGTKPK